MTSKTDNVNSVGFNSGKPDKRSARFKTLSDYINLTNDDIVKLSDAELADAIAVARERSGTQE